MTNFFTNSVIEKGRLRLVDPTNTDNVVMSRSFLYNPNSISDKKSTEWAKHTVPGVSHPVYQFVAGGPRVLEFELFITGDDANTLSVASIEEEIRFYQSLCYSPSPAGSSYTGVSPYLIEFNFGSYYGGQQNGNPVTNAVAEGLAKAAQTVQNAISNIPFLGSGNSLGNFVSGFSAFQAPKKTYWIAMDVAVDNEKWNHNLAPVSATIRISLEEFPKAHVSWSNFMSRSS